MIMIELSTFQRIPPIFEYVLKVISLIDTRNENNKGFTKNRFSEDTLLNFPLNKNMKY